MPIELTDFEQGLPFPGNAEAELAALQRRIGQLQLSQIVHRKRAIILFEGWTGSNKKAALKALVGALDPTHVRVVTIGQGDADDEDRHWLAPFWRRIPSAGDTTIFYRSWYRRMVEQRILGMDDKRWTRACDEINEFESQQRDHGTMLVKLFFHVTADRQAATLRMWQEDPWLRHLQEHQPSIGVSQRERSLEVLHDFFSLTSTRWAPWTIIDDNDPVGGRIAALQAIVEQMEKAMPSEPPASGDTVIQFRNSKAEPRHA